MATKSVLHLRLSSLNHSYRNLLISSPRRYGHSYDPEFENTHFTFFQISKNMTLRFFEMTYQKVVKNL